MYSTLDAHKHANNIPHKCSTNPCLFSIAMIFIPSFGYSNEPKYSYRKSIKCLFTIYAGFLFMLFGSIRCNFYVAFQFVFRISCASSNTDWNANLSLLSPNRAFKIFHVNKLLTTYCVVNPFTLQIVRQLENNNNEQTDTPNKTSNKQQTVHSNNSKIAAMRFLLVRL